MLDNIKKFINKTVGYNPTENAGKFSGTGSHIDDKERESGPNGHDPMANVLNVHPDGKENNDRNAKTTMSDVADWKINATQELLGNPQVARPSKNAHRNVDQELKNQYFGNMETR